MLTGGNKVYSEVEGMQLLLQYRVRQKKRKRCAHIIGINTKPRRRPGCVWIDDSVLFPLCGVCVSLAANGKPQGDGVEAVDGGGAITMASSW